MHSSKVETYIYGAVQTPIEKFNEAVSSFTAPELSSMVISEAFIRAEIGRDQVDAVY